MSFIYRATNKKNGKCYIGRTNYKRLNSRIACHMWYARHIDNNLPFANALRKYDRDGFIWDILEECDKDIVGEREMYWIEELKPYYNVTKGGDGGRSGVPCPQHVREAARKANSKSIRCVETGIEYSSARDAGRKLGKPKLFSGISNVLNGKAETAGGYHWETAC